MRSSNENHDNKYQNQNHINNDKHDKLHSNYQNLNQEHYENIIPKRN
jgi:hypothetical protein